MNFSLLFVNPIKKEIKRLEKKGYLQFVDYITPDFLKKIKDEKFRDKLYDIYCDYPQWLEHFVKLYDVNSEIAKLTLDLGLLSDMKLEHIVNNINLYDKFIKKGYPIKILSDEYISFYDEKFNIYRKYGDKFFELINLDSTGYMFVFNKKIDKIVDIDFIINNYDLIKYCYNKYYSDEKYFANAMDIMKINTDVFYKLDSIGFNKIPKVIINFIKANKDDIESVNNIVNIVANNIVNISTYAYDEYSFSQLCDLVGGNVFEDYQSFENFSNSYKKFCKNVSVDAYIESIFFQYTIKFRRYDPCNFNNYIKAGYNVDDDKVIKMLIEINMADSVEQVDFILSKYNILPDPISLNNRLIEFQNQKLNIDIFSPVGKDSYVNEAGVRIIDDSTSDLSQFKMTIHSLKDRKQDNSPNGELSLNLMHDPSIWIDKNVLGSDIICCSVISQNDLRLWGVEGANTRVFLGFSDYDNPYIHAISTGDAVTKMEGKNRDFSQTDKLAPFNVAVTLTDNIIGCGAETSGHNEFSFGRFNNGEKIKPSYLLSIKNFGGDKNHPIDDLAIKWAKFYDIPIVVLDGEKIKERAFAELKTLMDGLKSGIVSETLFYNIMLQYRTIENVMGKPMDAEIDSFINLCLDIVIANPNSANINEINNINKNYSLSLILSHKESKASEENAKLRIEKLNRKLEQINQLIYQDNELLESNRSFGKGFASFYYLIFGMLMSLSILLIIFLGIILKYK